MCASRQHDARGRRVSERARDRCARVQLRCRERRTEGNRGGVVPGQGRSGLVDDERICLIRSRRLTVGETLIEVPAGTREPDEPPLRTAHRELAEETGYRAANLNELVSFYPSPGISNERMWIYVADGLTAGEPKREPNEEIENLVLTWGEALALVERGEIRDGKTLVALLSCHRKNS